MNSVTFSPTWRQRIIYMLRLLIITASLSGVCAIADVGKPMRFDHLGMDEGLSQSAVNVMHQDKTGFMWLGTENGLNRYDGYRFHHYKHDPADPNSLGKDFIWDITEDDTGNLWIATNGGGLARWNADKDNFTIYRHDAGNKGGISHDVIRAAHYTSDGFVWLGTKGAGLDRLHIESGVIENFRHDPANPNSLGDDNVYSIVNDSRGNIWIGTNNGLSRFDPITKSFTTLLHDPDNARSISSNMVRTLMEDRQGNLWVGTRNAGVNRLDRESGQFTRFVHDPENRSSISNNGIRSVFEDNAGRIWIGTTKGLNLFDRERLRFYQYTHERTNPGNLSDSYIMSIYQDKAGILWVGTRNKGANIWNPRSWGFGHFSPDRLSQGNVTSFAEDSHKTLWVGTFGGGLNRINRSTSEVTFIQKNDDNLSISDNSIMSMLVDGRDNLWLGTMVGGLDRINIESGEITNFKHDPDNPETISNNGIMALFEDRDGNLWIGTFGGGVNKMAPDGTVKRFPFNKSSTEGLISQRATAIAQDSFGHIWIGTDGGGLSIYNQESGYFTHFKHNQDDPTSLASDTIYALHRDINNVMWIGTQGGGLSQAVGASKSLATLSFRRFIPESGPTINNVVYGIESDMHGDLWLSTNYGLSQYSPDTGKVLNFHRNHGLQDEEFNFGAHYRSSAGQLFFGGANGFNAFYPSDLEINTVAPDVVLTGISLLNEPIKTDTPHWLKDDLELSYRDEVLSLEFSALDFAAPMQNRYAYKLEGFDPKWIEVGNKRHVTYTNLDPGNYKFLIKAANSDGVWQTESVKLNLKTIAPPWQSAWAYCLYALAGLGVIALFWSAHQKQLHQEAQFRYRLEKDVQARTRELAERNGQLKQLNQRFLQASITDPLTGLRNRRYVFEEIAKDIDVVRRRYSVADHTEEDPNQSDFIFMMIDLDNFKPVNDTCGHGAGDEMLIQIKDLLLAACRSSDVVIRWGGDEFLVIGRYADLRQGEALAERIRTNMANAVFSVGNGQATRTTCSIGLTGYPFTRSKPDLLDWEQLLSLADTAMYRAKATRNSWVSMISTEHSQSVINPFYSFRDHTDAMVDQGMLELRSSNDVEAEVAAEA